MAAARSELKHFRTEGPQKAIVPAKTTPRLPERNPRENARRDTKKWPASRPLVSIRGSFFVPSGLGYAPP